jgi:hypothetical protein
VVSIVCRGFSTATATGSGRFEAQSQVQLLDREAIQATAGTVGSTWNTLQWGLRYSDWLADFMFTGF